jgi:hypothetical protein
MKVKTKYKVHPRFKVLGVMKQKEFKLFFPEKYNQITNFQTLADMDIFHSFGCRLTTHGDQKHIKVII